MCSCLFITVYCNILTQYKTHSNNINQFLNVHWVLRSVGRQESQRKEFVKGFITSTKEVCDLCFVRVTTIQLATLFHMSSEVSASWKPGPKICIQSYSWSLLEFHIWYIYIDFFSIYISYSFFCKVEQKVRGGRERKREKDMMRDTRQRSLQWSSENTGTWQSLLKSHGNHVEPSLRSQTSGKRKLRGSRRMNTIETRLV